MPAGTAEQSGALTFSEYDGRRERMGAVRAAVAAVIVLLAAGLVIAASVVILRAVEPASSPASDALASDASASGAPSAPAPTAGAEQAAAPVAASADAAGSSAPAPTVSEAPPQVQAAGRAGSGDRTVSFIVDRADLRAGQAVTVSVSAIGPAEDRVQRVDIGTADGTSLSSAQADGCTGPAYPWSQDFAITFAEAQATELQVQLTSCAGVVLTATSLVDIQP